MLMVVGIVLIFIGFLMFILPQAGEKRGTNDHLEDVEEEAKGENIRGGAVVMIGPIPVLAGSNPKTALLMMLIALVIMLVWAMEFKLG
ncbi:Uncharacterised protein [uncultured archaeon]|nr:Uncharacterised protein [uncultured archaeon]